MRIPNFILRRLIDWSENLRNSREPNFIIGEDFYLKRWWVIPKNRWMNIYLHEICSDDDDRALHDHPWVSASLILEGMYVEVLQDRAPLRETGQFVVRRAKTAHRLELVGGLKCVSLFITGPKIRAWGFRCPQGWRHWKDFCHSEDSSRIGRGCD